MVTTTTQQKLRRVRASAERTCVCGYRVNAPDVAACPRCREPLAAAAPKRRKSTHPEDAHQAALFAWAGLQAETHPELSRLFHVPNGGARNVIEAGRLKAQGVRAGVPDIFLDVARGGFFGLRVELKATAAELGRKPPVSPEQRGWIEFYQVAGYFACVCEGWDAARAVLLQYLAMPCTRPVIE